MTSDLKSEVILKNSVLMCILVQWEAHIPWPLGPTARGEGTCTLDPETWSDMEPHEPDDGGLLSTTSDRKSGIRTSAPYGVRC